MSKTLSSIVKDSAVIITLISVHLFVWGTMSIAFLKTAMEVPLEFIRETSVQETMLKGGIIALLFYLPVFLFIYLLLKFFNFLYGGKVFQSIKQFYEREAVGSVLLYLLAFLMSIILLVPISNFMVKNSPTSVLRVKSISLNPESKITTSYAGLFFITKKDSIYVFVDKFGSKEATVYILNESEIKEISFTKEIILPPQ